MKKIDIAATRKYDGDSNPKKEKKESNIMTTTIEIQRINRICGIVRNITILGFTLLWGLLGEFGFYRTTAGITGSVVLFIIFVIDAVIREMKKKYQKSVMIEDVEQEEDIAKLDPNEIECRISDINERIRKNEKAMVRAQIGLIISLILAVGTAIFSLSSKLMTITEMICVILLVWPSFQISKSVKFWLYRRLTKVN